MLSCLVTCMIRIGSTLRSTTLMVHIDGMNVELGCRLFDNVMCLRLVHRAIAFI